MYNTKFIGGILLIAGTSIGGGMLALPIATAALGFYNSLIFLILCWLIMTAGALLVLEVNLRLPIGSNIISMAKATLGLPGQLIAWLSYLCLLYTLLSGYIAGGNDIFNSILQNIAIYLPAWSTAIIFTAIFGAIVYAGITAVDYVNRVFMIGKFSIYILLIIIISPKINFTNLHGGNLQAITASLMILVTSFGFASIVPTLRAYFYDDIKTLRQVILMGSLIPLVCYIFWNAAIMGVIQRAGDYGLINLMDSSHSTSGLITALSHAIVYDHWINACFSIFSSICMVTAFLGVSLGLFDFLADGFNLNKEGKQGFYTVMLTFLPPLIIVLFKPGIYIQALSYAGICCVVLLLLLPALMAWRARKIKLNGDNNLILIKGGYVSLVMIIAISLLLLFIAICV